MRYYLFSVFNIRLNMLPISSHGTSSCTVIMLHWLGGSEKTWTELSERLSTQGLNCIAIDLPGFGRAASNPNFEIAATVNEVIATIKHTRSNHEGPWILAGHSMGGKFAAIIARAALDGRPGLENLKAILLLSPSPPGPEPMSEGTRDKMLASLGSSTRSAEEDRENAKKFVDANIGKLPLDPAIHTRTVDDVLRMNRAALIAWLTNGSKEDWSQFVGSISIPTLILAGTEEAALGPDAQAEHTLLHFPDAAIIPLVGGGHLAPIERPGEVALRATAFIKSLGIQLRKDAPPMEAAFLSLIQSERTSPQTREVLRRRIAEDDDVNSPNVLVLEEYLILQAVADRIFPHCPFDLASRIHRWLALPQHDGWRHDSLPPDVEAWRIGLNSFDTASLGAYGVPFIALDAPRQDQLLISARDAKLSDGIRSLFHLGEGSTHFNAKQMSEWFGDLTAELTKIYVADPRTMARIGFTGFADEGGFTHIQLGQHEEFERGELEQ